MATRNRPLGIQKGHAQLALYERAEKAVIKQARTLPPPTTRQMIILWRLDSFIREHGKSPSFRELAAYALCKSVRTVTEHIQSLQRKGLVTKLHMEARTLYLTKEGEKALKGWDKSKLVFPSTGAPINITKIALG